MTTKAAADSRELIAQSQKILREGRALQVESKRRLVESYSLLDQCTGLIQTGVEPEGAVTRIDLEQKPTSHQGSPGEPPG